MVDKVEYRLTPHRAATTAQASTQPSAEASASDVPIVRELGCCDYQSVLERMRIFTDRRDPSSADELWLLEHAPVFTLGQAADLAHLLDPGDIPVFQSDRGGQVTYHAPGQLVVYVMVDLRRRGLGVRTLVTLLEDGVVQYLRQFDVHAHSLLQAPGVYVGERKIAALGLRVRRSCSFHGLALNVDMDLEPYQRINPCGYSGQRVTRTLDLGITADVTEAGRQLAKILSDRLQSLSAASSSVER